MRGEPLAMVRKIAVLLLVALASAGPVAAGDSRRDLTPNQLTASSTLTPEEALAACGPAAAVAFARARGRDVTLDTAVAQARQVGWTPENGMAGPLSMVTLLERMQIPARLEAGLDRAKVRRELRAGRPVIVRMAGEQGHYLVAERYEPGGGTFDFGQSAVVLKRSGGERWFTLDQIGALGVGTPTHTIYLENTLTALGSPVASLPAVGPTPTPPRLRTIDAGGSGARLRAGPSTETTVVDLLPDGTQVTELDAEVTADGRTWRRVSAPDGRPGWVAADLLAPVAGMAQRD